MERKFTEMVTDYQPPLVEVIEVEVEKGFNQSTKGTLEDMQWD